jgi:nicotinate dehydrogenase subunit A
VPQTFEFTVNGKAVSVALDNEETPLIDVLRNALGLMGTRFGCGLEQCGCCMVLIDGAPEKCCTKPVWSVAGKSVTTIEGLGTAERPHPLQQAFLDDQAGQCGYCLSGIIVSDKALLDKNSSPTRAEIAVALDGNICRCGSHNRILRAVEKAASVMREGAQR